MSVTGWGFINISYYEVGEQVLLITAPKSIWNLDTKLFLQQQESRGKLQNFRLGTRAGFQSTDPSS